MLRVKTESTDRAEQSAVKLSNKGVCSYESLEVVCIEKTPFAALLRKLNG